MTNTGIVDLHSNNVNLELGGIKIGMIKIPSDYVPYTFAPILGVHDLIAGDHLMEGMIVVVEDNVFRRNPNVLSPEYPDRARGFVPSEYDRASVEEQSRWALVTDLDKSREIIKFTAIYSDGTMRSRSYNKSIKWAVLQEFEMLPVCPNCGVTHQTGEERLPNIDEMTRDVTQHFFGEEMSFDDFSDRLKDDPSFLDDILDKTLGKIFGPEDEQPTYETPADAQLPGETPDEMKDPIKLADDDTLAALRARLMGQSNQ